MVVRRGKIWLFEMLWHGGYRGIKIDAAGYPLSYPIDDKNSHQRYHHDAL